MFFGTAVCCISPWVECSKLQEDENLRLNYTQGHMNHSSTRKEACHNASPSYVVVCCVALVGQLMMILHQGNYLLIVWNQNLIPQNDNKIKYHPPPFIEFQYRFLYSGILPNQIRVTHQNICDCAGVVVGVQGRLRRGKCL